MVHTVVSRVLENSVFVTAPTIPENFSRADRLAGHSCRSIPRRENVRVLRCTP